MKRCKNIMNKPVKSWKNVGGGYNENKRIIWHSLYHKKSNVFMVNMRKEIFEKAKEQRLAYKAIWH